MREDPTVWWAPEPEGKAAGALGKKQENKRKTAIMLSICAPKPLTYLIFPSADHIRDVENVEWWCILERLLSQSGLQTPRGHLAWFRSFVLQQMHIEVLLHPDSAPFPLELTPSLVIRCPHLFRLFLKLCLSPTCCGF